MSMLTLHLIVYIFVFSIHHSDELMHIQLGGPRTLQATPSQHQPADVTGYVGTMSDSIRKTSPSQIEINSTTCHYVALIINLG